MYYYIRYIRCDIFYSIISYIPLYLIRCTYVLCYFSISRNIPTVPIVLCIPPLSPCYTPGVVHDSGSDDAAWVCRLIVNGWMDGWLYVIYICTYTPSVLPMNPAAHMTCLHPAWAFISRPMVDDVYRCTVCMAWHGIMAWRHARRVVHAFPDPTTNNPRIWPPLQSSSQRSHILHEYPKKRTPTTPMPCPS
jgi:hypothetical protein